MEWSLPSPEMLGLLQKYILSKSGIQVVSPGDCRQISKYVEGITGKLISETTMKRFFGFARQPYNFSRFTLNALCEYAGFDGWEHFCGTVSQNEDLSPNHTMWEEFRQKALDTTRITQLTLKNLSGIPFSATISRSAIESDFDYFLRSDYRFFCLTGAAGMGKSIQMAHLTEQFFLQEEAPYHDSIVWFLRNNDLHKITPYDFNFEESTKGQFETGKKFTFFEHFRQHPAEVKGKLVLMLDGFDEHLFDTAELEDIFQKIIDILCCAQDLDWLKIVVSLRTSTWFQLQKRINASEYLKTTWFSGIYYQKDASFNLMPLSAHERNGVLKNIRGNTGSGNSIATENPALQKLFGYPYYLHLYYRLLKENKRGALRGNALYCELVTSFVFQKIYQSGHSMEKIRILQKLVRLTDYGRSGEPVDRGNLFEANELYVAAYNELVSEGILLERNNNNAFNYRIDVQFMQEPLFVYFIARELIDQEKKSPGIHLFERVMREYAGEEKRSLLLKWVLLHIVVQKTQDMHQVIFNDMFSSAGKCDSLIFVCDLLEDNPDIITEEEKKVFVEQGACFLATHFLELHLSEELGAAVRTLLDHASGAASEANLLIIQSLMAITSLDKFQLSRIIERLRQLDRQALIHGYPMDPLSALESVYRFYAMEPGGHAYHAAIDAFIDAPPEKVDKMPGTATILSYQLGMFVSIFNNRPSRIIALTDVIRYLHPALFSTGSCYGITMYLLLRQAFAYLRNNMKSQAGSILEQLKKCHEKQGDSTGYSLFAGLYGILQGEIAMSERKYQAAADYLSGVYYKSKKPGLFLFQVYAALPLIRVYKLQGDFDAMGRIMKDVRLTMARVDFPVEKLLLNKIMEQV